jgi:hypothetical protein
MSLNSVDFWRKEWHVLEPWGSKKMEPEPEMLTRKPFKSFLLLLEEVAFLVK